MLRNRFCGPWLVLLGSCAGSGTPPAVPEAPIVTNTTTRRATLERLVGEVVNRDRPEVADEIIAPDFVVHPAGFVPDSPSGPGGASRGPEAYRAAARRLKAPCPDFQIHVEDVIEQGDRVAVRWRGVGTHTGAFMGRPPSGRRIVVHGMVVYRFAGDRVAEMWPMVDRYGALQQMGIVAIDPPR